MKEQNEYLKNWLFCAIEDVAVIDRLFETDFGLYASTICIKYDFFTFHTGFYGPVPPQKLFPQR